MAQRATSVNRNLSREEQERQIQGLHNQKNDAAEVSHSVTQSVSHSVSYRRGRVAERERERERGGHIYFVGNK